MAPAFKDSDETIEPAALSAWLRSRMPEAVELEVSGLRHPSAGESSDTQLFEARWREAGEEKTLAGVLRCAPRRPGPFPSYDLPMQFEIMQTLGERKTVPVPEVIWLEEDLGIFGAPFLVMRQVEGDAPLDFPSYQGEGMYRDASPEVRAHMWHATIEAVAELHAQDWRELGLTRVPGARAGDDPARQQLDTWRDYLDWIRDQEAERLAVFDEALAWLEARHLPSAPLSLCWGDAKQPNRTEHDTSSVRWIMSGAAPVPVSLIKDYAGIGIEIHQVYGLTETCGPACLISPEEAIAKAGSTGPAFLHTDVRVVDEDGADVEPGAIGEVIIRGAHVMKGYWNQPEATAETIRDGWLYSGDLASVDKEGFVYIQDRIKDMIISGGENIYPAEIENVILSHPGVREVAVIGQPSAKWGESPLAVVVPSDEGLEAQAVLEYCNGKLARYKQPRGVEFLDEIPRNPTGKVLKRLLRERFPGPAPE